jgi:amidophosphoribosyltransferase
MHATGAYAIALADLFCYGCGGEGRTSDGPAPRSVYQRALPGGPHAQIRGFDGGGDGVGGLFGISAEADCVDALFYGTDYHCHLGTRRGGLAVVEEGGGYTRFIHDITNAQFKSKFETDIGRMHGRSGIGVISDFEDQPLIVGSHLGVYAIATVGVVQNLAALTRKAYHARATHFSEMSGNEINPTELIATLINQEESFEAGIRRAHEEIDGSCSLLLLTQNGVYAARDKLGRTPLVLGRGDGVSCVASESCALPNLGFTHVRDLGPGEVVILDPAGARTVVPPGPRMQICSFLWVYYGFPASSYEGVNVEQFRYASGATLARADRSRDGGFSIDAAAGIPDSGTSHAVGYAHESGVPYTRPFAKYTPTWPRSFMPQRQAVRDLVARMKLIPIRELAEGKRLLFCDDSIVRGTQLRNTFHTLYSLGAREVHLRIACPPLCYGCRFLNFSRSGSEMDLAARRMAAEMEGRPAETIGEVLEPYTRPGTDQHERMVARIGASLNVTSLRYQTLEGLVSSIGLPEEKLCTYCWTGRSTPA